ncbi:MAG TPA: alpha/beta fold hydrolase [Terracidiphilus sp.]|nr:alpha/beta fold hydrolase [Terracidiphilus sp.]
MKPSAASLFPLPIQPRIQPRIQPLVVAAAFSFAALLALPLGAQQPARPLTVADIYAHGSLYGNPPQGIEWSPDGKHLTYLDGGEMIDLDPGSGKPHVLISRTKIRSLVNSDISERDRDHRARYSQASYLWAPDARHMLFDSNGRLWLYDLSNGIGLQIAFAGETSGDDPKFSPNGEAISFIRDRSLAVVHLQTPGTPTVTLAPSREPTLLNGQVDWVYEEELDVRSNYFWSPDSKRIAFLQMDEASVPQYPITDWIPTHSAVYMQRYPQPGDPNPTVRVGVVGAEGGRTQWMHVPINDGQDYIPRFGWVDRHTLWIETLSRDHQHKAIYFADSRTGEVHPVLELSDDKFLPEAYDVSVAGGAIILTSWADGHSHIYLYSYDADHPQHTQKAALVRQLTRGDFDVAKIYRVDHARKLVDFASNEGNPLQQQIWRVTFAGQRTQLTASAGTHDAAFGPPSGASPGTFAGAFVDDFSTRMDPPTLALCSIRHGCRVFWQSHALDAWGLRPPIPLQVKTKDGSTLFATLLLPAAATSPASVPLILNPYGGPGDQLVADKWADSLLFDEVLAQHGFAVLHADNRGTGNRGRAFAQACYHNFGPIQFEDQLTVLASVLAQYPQLNPHRLGWWGWSWGGTFTLYAMTHSDRFRAGVSVAPVTDWRNYDSIYTERYLGLPSQDPEAYKTDSVVNFAAHLHGRLLLVHGTGDDNVHMENTVQFIQQLIQAQIPYDLQLYPRKTHSIAGPVDRTHLYTRILAHFERYLMPPVQ